MGKKERNNVQTETNTNEEQETNGALYTERQTHASDAPPEPPTEKQKRPRKPKQFLILAQSPDGTTTTQAIEGEDEAFAEYARRVHTDTGVIITCYQVEKVELMLSAKRA